MKIVTKLTDDQKQLLLSYGTVCNDNDQMYYHISFWFKQLEGGEAEVLVEEQLPDNLRKWIKENRLNKYK